MTDTSPIETRSRRARLIGYAALGCLVVGLGGWALTARISGAVIAPGQIEVDGRRQVVEHPEGGTIAETRAKEGGRVAAGEVLLRLDDAQIRGELASIETRLFEMIARRDRLIAERDVQTKVRVSDELREAVSGRPGLSDQIAGQHRLFTARRRSLNAQISQLKNRIAEIEAQIAHAGDEIGSLNIQLQLVQTELAAKAALRERAIVSEPEVLALKREAARLGGALAAAERQRAKLRAETAETRIEMEKINSRFRESAIAELRDIRSHEAELREERDILRERLDRTVIRATATGTIHGLSLRGPGDVIRPAEAILSIVPSEAGLVAIGHLPIHDVEEVAVGQKVQLRFSALSQRQLPEILGRVTRVSADAIINETTGDRYYEIEVAVDADTLSGLGDVTVMPGMPVDAFIRTTDRTPLAYLVDPLTDYFSRVFIES